MANWKYVGIAGVERYEYRLPSRQELVFSITRHNTGHIVAQQDRGWIQMDDAETILQTSGMIPVSSQFPNETEKILSQVLMIEFAEERTQVDGRSLEQLAGIRADVQTMLSYLRE